MANPTRSEQLRRQLEQRRKDRRMNTLDALKNFNATTLQLDEALALHAQAKQLRAEHEAFAVSVPDWLTDAIRTLNNYIVSQRRDALELRLARLKEEEERLLTPTERREKVKAEREQLEKQLGVATV